jgi:crossover junction endodeoxyribonuclease RuvC
MHIMGIDSGIERVGWAVFDRNERDTQKSTYIASGLIKTPKKATELRLFQIYEELDALFDRYQIVELAIEQLFFFKNQKTVIPVAQAQGAVLTLCAKHAVPVTFLTPLQIKQVITGYGTADKKSVQKMLGIILGLKAELKQDDQADAIGCALAYCYQNRALLQ